MTDAPYKYVGKRLPELGENIRLWRKSQGLKQTELEQRAGLAHNYISRVETGDVTNPRPNNLEKIAAVFGISVDALLLKSPNYGVIDEPAEYDTGVLVDRLESLPGPKRAAVVSAFYSLLEQIGPDDD